MQFQLTFNSDRITSNSANNSMQYTNRDQTVKQCGFTLGNCEYRIDKTPGSTFKPTSSHDVGFCSHTVT